MELYKLTVHEVRDLIDSKAISSSDLLKSILGRINEVENKLNSFITIDTDSALDQAKKLDETRPQGKQGLDLVGIPYGVKDNISTKDMPTSCASKMLRNYRTNYDATVVKKLRDKGAILVGKLNLDSFAIGSSGETSYFTNTKNPWRLNKVPGGSSGGSAAAVAADLIMFSLGTDTGGSIRQPAAFCGIVGMKPTYGLVSRYGLFPLASSLDQIGPLTKDVRDCAIVLNAITGHDQKDSSSIDKYSYPDYRSFLFKDIKGLRIGIPQELLKDASLDVKNHIKKAAKHYVELGAKVEETSFKLSKYSVPVYFLISSAEAASNLARFYDINYKSEDHSPLSFDEIYIKSRTEGFASSVKRRIMIGNLALEANNYEDYYLQATKIRATIRKELEKLLKDFDLLLSPTTPSVAFNFSSMEKDLLNTYKWDASTVPANLAGLPAISIPCGFSNDGLPIGMQLMGRPYGEGTLLMAAHAFEQSTDYHKKRLHALEV